MNNIAIAGASGTFKGVFVHGVLTAFERRGFVASAYASASSSTISCAAAACQISDAIGLDYWLSALEKLRETNGDLSEVVLHSIREYGPRFRNGLFDTSGTLARLMIAASRVNNDTAAVETQGAAAKRLGKRLLIDAMRKNSQWVAANLDPWIFDTLVDDTAGSLTRDNFDEVAYATTRMMHAWKIPATVGGVPFVDASYTDACPVAALAGRGYRRIVAISPSPPPVYTNIFQDRLIGEGLPDIEMHIIAPEADPQTLGVDFTSATEEGLVNVYEQGIAAGDKFLNQKSDQF